MTDPFDDFAEENTSRARKAMLARAETREQKRKAKQLIERDYLFEQWQKWHKKRKAELLAGEWARPAQKLIDFLERMDFNSADELIELMRPWRHADDDTRFLVQSIVGHAIIYLRESNGLPPFDDPLPFSMDDEPNVTMVIREMLR